MKKTIVYADGSNLHNQLKSVGLLEKDIDWREFFEHALPEHYDILRASWYHVNRVSPHQWYPSLTRRYCPTDMDEQTFEQRCRAWYESECIRLQKLHDEVHARIAIENDLVDFRYTGVLRLNPYTQERIEEKGVSVGLAVDLVTQVDSYDVAVIVACDHDVAEAVRYAKSRGKQVHAVTIEPGTPTETRGPAWALRVLVDYVTPFFESELKSPQYKILRDPSQKAEIESRAPREGRQPAGDGGAMPPLGYRDRKTAGSGT